MSTVSFKRRLMLFFFFLLSNSFYIAVVVVQMITNLFCISIVYLSFCCYITACNAGRFQGPVRLVKEPWMENKVVSGRCKVIANQMRERIQWHWCDSFNSVSWHHIPVSPHVISHTRLPHKICCVCRRCPRSVEASEFKTLQLLNCDHASAGRARQYSS